MSKAAPKCLRCAERAATKGWQRADCAESFADWGARDWQGALVGRATEAVEDLARAIEQHQSR